jgi:hypothetical protein
MGRSAPSRWALVACLFCGCSTMKGASERHPGVVDKNPAAVTRVYPASATRVAWALTEVMKKDSIIDDVQLMVDPQSNDSRALSATEREALGVGKFNKLTRDVNYNIKAKSKDGHPIGALVLLKGESSAEVSLLYGSSGDPELSRALLDEVEVALTKPVTDPGVIKAAAAAKTPRKRAPGNTDSVDRMLSTGQ